MATLTLVDLRARRYAVANRLGRARVLRTQAAALLILGARRSARQRLSAAQLLEHAASAEVTDQEPTL